MAWSKGSESVRTIVGFFEALITCLKDLMADFAGRASPSHGSSDLRHDLDTFALKC